MGSFWPPGRRIPPADYGALKPNSDRGLTLPPPFGKTADIRYIAAGPDNTGEQLRKIEAAQKVNEYPDSPVLKRQSAISSEGSTLISRDSVSIPASRVNRSSTISNGTQDDFAFHLSGETSKTGNLSHSSSVPFGLRINLTPSSSSSTLSHQASFNFSDGSIISTPPTSRGSLTSGSSQESLQLPLD